MIAPLTKREIRNAGYGRYIRTGNRYWLAMGGMVIFLLLSAVVSIITENHWAKWLSSLVSMVLVLVGFIPVLKITLSAEKAGKKFLAEWEKEHGVIQQEK